MDCIFPEHKKVLTQSSNNVVKAFFIIKYFGVRIYNSYSEFTLFCLAFEILAFSSNPVSKNNGIKIHPKQDNH